jgi:hypothetical protein
VKRRRPLLERLVLAWRVARGRAAVGAGRPAYRPNGGRASRSDDGGPARRRGFSVIPGLLDDFAQRAADEAATMPQGAVETGGERPGAISHAETFNAPTRTARVSAPAPTRTPIYGPAVQTPTGYVKYVVGYK